MTASRTFEIEDRNGAVATIAVWGTYITEDETNAGWWEDFGYEFITKEDGYIPDTDKMKEYLHDYLD